MSMMPLNPTSNYHDFSILPPLPAGISIRTEDGVIRGTPTELSKMCVYTITAISKDGVSNSTTVTITVFNNFHYEPNSLVATVKQPITPMVPSEKLHFYTISPALPVGLTINTSTGVIEGTPTRPYEIATYTIHAASSSTMVYTTITITVNNNKSALNFTPFAAKLSIPIIIAAIVIVVSVIVLAVKLLRKPKQEEIQTLV